MPGQNTIFPVVLCGGSGTRLWPLSRELYPKPFVVLASGESLFSNTLARLKGLPESRDPIIVTNEEHRFYVREALAQGGLKGSIILEPAPRNTAPAIYLGALAVAAKGGEDALMLVAPSDHYFEDGTAFQETIEKAIGAAKEGKIITFGIEPTRPESAYGYILAGEPYGNGCRRVTKFVEKPSEERAAQMLAEGNHYWNSGIFLLKAATLIAEMRKYRPDIAEICDVSWKGNSEDHDFVRPDPELLRTSPEDSIDYAIMEKTELALMAPLGCAWNDMGSWEAFCQEGRRDAAGNVSTGDVILEDVENSYICSQGRLVAAVGIKDMAIVDSGDAVLVLPRSRCQEVKKIVTRLKAENREEARTHPVVYRPWGSYERLSAGERFQVKRIIVKPDCSLSLQMHHHRSEHWIIVRGTAEITVGVDKRLYSENESVYIPIGKLHKLHNPGKIPLELIEVQSGAYLGDDDIERVEDGYGRK